MQVILPCLLFCFAVLVGGEIIVRRLVVEQEHDALAQAEVGAGVVGQLMLRRIEAADVLHRLAQAWFKLQEQGNREGARALEEHLAETAQGGSFGFGQVALVNADGWMEWSSISGRESRVYLGDRQHVRAHFEGWSGTFISEPVLGRVSNRWTLQISRGLWNRQGRLGGVVVVTLDLLNLSEALAELHKGGEIWSLILRNGSRIVASSANTMTRMGTDLPPNDSLRNLPREAMAGALKRVNPAGRHTFTGWYRMSGTNLVAAYILDATAVAEQTQPLVITIRFASLSLALLGLLGGALYLQMRERREGEERARIAQQQQALSDEAHRVFEQRINSLPAVLFGGAVDVVGNFSLTYVSENLTRITGWQREDISGAQSPWVSIAVDVPVAQHAAFMRDVIAAGQGTREFRIRRPDGNTLIVREHLRLVDAHPSGISEVVGYFRDISPEREMEMKAQAAGRLATLGEMATGLAHELNQPLAVMSLAADNAGRALRRNGAEAIPSVLERLERIGTQGRRARDIVDHLRVFGRAQDQDGVNPLRLGEALDGALVLTRAALRDARITVRQEIPEELPEILARLIPLEQTIMNVLLNARDALAEHAPEDPWISIRAWAAPAAVMLEIADNGGGIPEELLFRIFEPFFTTKAAGKGTGLGMPICLATMRSFGGSITAANRDGGAVFTLQFRVAA